jgi:hypothetical protein
MNGPTGPSPWALVFCMDAAPDCWGLQRKFPSEYLLPIETRSPILTIVLE